MISENHENLQDIVSVMEKYPSKVDINDQQIVFRCCAHVVFVIELEYNINKTYPVSIIIEEYNDMQSSTIPVNIVEFSYSNDKQKELIKKNG